MIGLREDPTFGSAPAGGGTEQLDAVTGDILRAEGVVLATGDTPIYIVSTYEDYRDIDGVRIAFRSTSFNDQTGRTVMTLRGVETNLNVSDDTFRAMGTPTERPLILSVPLYGPAVVVVG